MFHLESGTLLMRFAGVKQERDFIYSSFGVEETFVASGSEDKCVYIWHRNRQLPIAVLSGHTKQVRFYTLFWDLKKSKQLYYL